jgi:DNA/RNA endonuclease YhcR with UshA esterase domain
MRQLPTFLLFLFLVSGYVHAGTELSVVWEKNAAQGTLPGWFDTGHMTRGLSYGHVDGQDRVYVVSRNGGNFIYILNAATGDSLGRLDNTGLSGGTYTVSDVGVSSDGRIYVCNLSINSTFKVYQWDSEAAAPVAVIGHSYSGRLGDKFTVSGSAADNSLKIYAASANTNEVLMFSTADNGVTFSADTIAIDATGGSSSVGPLADGSFYWNAGGSNPKKYSSNGALEGTVPGTVVATGSNSIRYVTNTGAYDYFVTFQYGVDNENARIVRAPATSADLAETYSTTPSMYANSNVNGTGDVSVKDNGDGSFTIFVLSTNNGLGAYSVQFPVEPVITEGMVANYELHAGDVAFFQADNNTRGMGYNAATNHMLVASRTGGAYIYVVEQGVVVDTLDMTGVSGGTYTLNMVVADAHGVIYAGNLALANGLFKIYRWADEQSAPTVAFEGTVTQRAGDVLALSGSGTSTVLYASGSGATEIQVYTTADGSGFSAQTPITVAAGTARGGISPVTNSVTSDLWVNGSGTTVQKIDASGNVLTEISGSVVSSSWMNVQYMEADNGAKLLAVNANNVAGDRRKVQVWNITSNEAEPELWAAGETWNIEATNANGSGSLAYVNRGSALELAQLTTNNAMASWSVPIPEVTPVETIAAVRVDQNGDLQPDRLGEVVRIRGIVNSPNYSTGTQYYLQDATGGIQLYGGSTMNLVWNAGDEIEITGTVAYYRGSTELTGFTEADVTVLSSGNELIPQTISIGQLGEANESQLVQLDSVWIVNPAAWPPAGSNSSSTDQVLITDGTDTTYIFIDKETDLDGWTPPLGLMNLIALSDQYTSASTVHDDGYSLRGTFRDHFIDLTVPPPSYYPPTNVAAEQYQNGALVSWELSTPSTKLAHHDGVVTSGFYQSATSAYGTVFDISQYQTARLELVEFNHFGFNFLSGPYQYSLYIYDWGDSLIAQIDSLEARDAFGSPVWELVDVGGLVANGVDSIGIFIQGLTVDSFGDVWPTVTTDGTTPPVAGGQLVINDLAAPFASAVVGNQSLGAFLINAWLETTGGSEILASVEQPASAVFQTAGVAIPRAKITPVVRTQSPLDGFSTEQYVLSGFKIYRGADAGSLSEVGSVLPGEFAYYDAAAPQDSSYYYGVAAVYGDSSSAIVSVEYYQPNLPNVVISPDSLGFGEIAINGTSTLPLQIVNSGLGELLVQSMSFGSDYFSASISADTTVAANDTLDVWVTFAPAVEDSVSDLLTIATNVGNYQITLTGSGYLLWPLNYRLAADTAAWMGSSSNAPRSMAYSKFNNHLYFVAHPNGFGDFVKAFDAETGDFVKDLNLDALISGGYISISAIAASPDGQVFASNLSSDAGSFNLYRWENEDAPSALVFSAPLGKRSGDALAAVGSGNDVKVYTSGLGSDTVFVFGTNDGTSFSLENSIVLPAASAARQGISPVDANYLFINSSAGAPQYLKNDGTVLYTFDTNQITSGTAINYFEVRIPTGVRRFVGITNGWSSGTTVVELLGTPGDDLCSSIQVVEAPTDNYSSYTNGNASGTAVYSSINNALIELITNNGVSSYSMDVVVPDAVNDTVSTVEGDLNRIPLTYALGQNYPNPFNPVTTISVALPKNSDVLLDIYNVLGQKVATVFDGSLPAGNHKLQFSGGNLGSGVYFYVIRADKFTDVKKMVLMK